MSIYAKDTDVSAERSRGEIEQILSRYGATAFAYATSQDKAMIQFQASGRRIMFVLTLPKREDPDVKYHSRNGKPTYRTRTDLQMQEVINKGSRQKWRCLTLAIKAKLESVASGIATFEDEFMAHIVMPDGKTVSQHVSPLIESAYKNGKMVPLLPHFNTKG